MFSRYIKAMLRPACPLALASVSLAAAADDSGANPWQAEIGASVGHHDNFFLRGDSAATSKPSATLTRLYASGEREVEAGATDWTFFGGAAATFVSGVDDADSQELELGIRGKWGRFRATLEGAYRPNLLYSEEGVGAFYDHSGLTVGARLGLPGEMWFGAEFERSRWEFDSSNSARDADGDELTATFRFPLGEHAAVRLIGIYAEKDASGPENSWDSSGYGAALEFSPAGRWSAFARVRSRDREYRDAPLGDTNFGRDDTIVDALVNTRVRIGDHWGMGGQVEYREGDSTRADRNYDALVISVSAFMTF